MWASYGLPLVGVGSIVGGDSKLSEAVRWGCGPFSVEGNQNGVPKEAGARKPEGHLGLGFWKGRYAVIPAFLA